MTTTDKTQTPGRAWTVVGTFPTFEAASSRADIERGTRGQQVKVKQIAAGFTVRTRRAELTPVESRPDYVEEKPTGDAPKRAKLKAKDRRAKQQRQSDTDEFDEE